MTSGREESLIIMGTQAEEHDECHDIANDSDGDDINIDSDSDRNIEN